MKVCPQCGFRHLDEDERCIRCGAALDAQALSGRLKKLQRAVAEPSRPALDAFSAVPAAPGRLAAWLRRRAYFLRRALSSELPEDVHHRNPWTAGFLSLVPGLGQIYNHQPKKALLIALWVGGCLAAAWATLYQPCSNWILLGCLGAWVYSFHDALVTAKRINREYFIWQHAIAFYCAWFFYICFFCIVFQYLAAHFWARFYTIGHDVLSPYLRRGERVVIEMVSRPQVGDVVMYNPRKLRVEFYGEVQNTHVSMDPLSMIERIVAGPGQTIERRAGVYYRDGRELSLSEEPLLSDYLPMDLKMTAPPDGFIILYSYTFGKDWMTGAETPKLNTPGMITKDWAEVCVVRTGEIVGRVWFVYGPPQARRILK